MLPLEGIRVLELTHLVAGPSAGVAMADLGADVIRVERPDGGHPRGPTKQAYAFLNRNKRSVALDLKQPEGRDAFLRLIETADVLIDNFAPGTLSRLGLGYDKLAGVNPGLIHLSVKGFLPGPYENRPLLDEPAQIMGGLAYMTGPVGQPLRVGASAVDIAGASYGLIAVLAALRQRDKTGLGQEIIAGLFETVVYWNAIAMADAVYTGEQSVPFPSRSQSARFGWGVYKLFDTADQRQVFIGLTSNQHWTRFCVEFDLPDLLGDERLTTNLDRAQERTWLIPRLRRDMAQYTFAELQEKLARANVPFAPLNRPDELHADPQLAQTGQLAPTLIPGHGEVPLPNLPVRSGGFELGAARLAPGLGEHTVELLVELGYTADEIAVLTELGAVRQGVELGRQWVEGPI